MLIKGLVGIALLILLSLVMPIGDLVQLLDPKNTQRWLLERGSMAPLLFVLLMATAVVLSPLPSLPLTLAAGAFFGPFEGGFYSILGGVLGSSLAFLIARLVGRQLLERVLTGYIQFCVHCSDKLLTRVVLVSRLLPFVSFDIVSYGAGLTAMSLRRFGSRHCYRDEPIDPCLHLFRCHTQHRPYLDGPDGGSPGGPLSHAPGLDRKVQLAGAEAPFSTYHRRR